MKKLPFMLALSLVASIFASCGNNSTSQTDTSVTADAIVSESTESAE